MKLGERVRAARDYAKLTQVQLAEHVGIEQQTLSDLERGKNTTSAKLPDIAFTCGIEPLWLVREEGPMVRTTQPVKTDNGMNQLLLAVVALVDIVSGRTQAEAKELRARLKAAREQHQANGLDASLLQNLEGVAEEAMRAQKRSRPSKKNR